MEDKAHLPVTVLEAETVINFLSSVAMAKALAQAVDTEPRRWVVWVAGMEVDSSSSSALRMSHETFTRGFIRQFRQRLAGPNAARNAKLYLDEMDRLRGRYIQRVEAAFGAAHYINSEMDRLMRSSLRALTFIRVTSLLSMPAMHLLDGGQAALALGTLSMPLGSTDASGGGSGLSQQVALTLLKEWDSAQHAKLLAMSTEAPRYGLNDELDKRPAPKLDKVQGALQHIAEHRPLHEKLLREMHEEVELLSKVQKRLTDAPREAEKKKKAQQAAVPKGPARSAAQQAADTVRKQAAQRRLTASLRRIPIVFAAPEVAGLLGRYAEEWNATQ
jgi:hypothetical protein